jgi:hypothetical protein
MNLAVRHSIFGHSLVAALDWRSEFDATLPTPKYHPQLLSSPP